MFKVFAQRTPATDRSRTLWLTGVLVCAALVLVEAAAGQLDKTFGGTGKVLTDISGGSNSFDNATDVAIDTEGRIVAVGSSRADDGDTDFAIVRHLPNGALDDSFGKNGRNIAEFGGTDYGAAMAIDTQGRIVVVGTTDVNDADGDFAIARFGSDGVLDPTFGTAGIVVMGMGGEDEGHAVAIDASGRILVAGDSVDGDNDFVVARLNSDGSLDTTFSGGKVRTGFGDWEGAYDIAIDSAGRIVLAGYAHVGSSPIVSHLALARYLDTGAPDLTFGQFGKTLTSVEAFGQAIVIDPAGRIIVAGPSDSGDPSEGYDFVLARFNPDATALDNLFGSGGKVITDFGGSDWVNDLAFDAEGCFVAVGYTFSGGYRFAMARYSDYGQLDDSFGTNGKVVLDLGGQNSADGVVIDAEQRIVIAGPAAADFVVARFDSRPLADLAIQKSANATTVVAGDAVTFSIQTFNYGPDAATSVSIVDNLPSSLTFMSCQASQGASCGGTGNSRTVDATSLPKSSGMIAALSARVNFDVPDGTIITNTATVGATEPDDPVSSNNSASSIVTVRNKSDLFLTERVTKLPGRQLSYTIEIRNLGPYSARQVVLNNPLPNGTNFVNATSATAACTLLPDGSVGTLSCTRGVLDSGQTMSVTFVVKVTAAGSVDIRNTATVSAGTFDPNVTNNTATLTTRVSGK
jgi:uncharacterized delta-60 repeat protein/uncharacterized repeat protein (TIGR01451 family)